MEEVPRPHRPLLTFDDRQRLAGEDEEVLLVGLPVVHRHRLAGLQHADVDPELREVGLAAEVVAFELGADAAALPFHPGRFARVQDEPALPLRNEPVRRLLERRLGNRH